MFLEAGVDQLALQQIQRRLVIKLQVIEGVGDDLCHPDEASLDVADEEQMDGTEQETTDPDREPDLCNLTGEISKGSPGLEQAEQGRIEEKDHGRQRPDRHQHDLALQIIADLDLLLVLVARVIDVVVPPRLKEEMA